ncbi:BZ3500_MvSof-1268-A1-R1_Chr2-2g04766 [Microbotryum saponariae]|uniref:BZ3500_MvSof-1268-A1-R1_Chr2-2g04766 protein n=1 Tax=Microbotryum saponariae TaxID=289078 RepID=A0A2X0MZP1_9BASI|nr:BZ3500_MvSof-1268-A1-R1_Chr2-2g04766 [Microbotryum saponariae]SDA00112.1 BZ3501_MvSof-1269-A2-R1_Chr2-2g04440 [Microbotryum saponariae]
MRDSTSAPLFCFALLCYALLVVKAIPASVQPLSRAKVVASLPSKRQQQQQESVLQDTSSPKIVASTTIDTLARAAVPDTVQAEAHEDRFVQPDVGPLKSVQENAEEQVVRPTSIRAAKPRHPHTMPNFRVRPELRLNNVMAKDNSPFARGVRDIGQRATMQRMPARASPPMLANHEAEASRSATKLYTDLKRAVEEFALSRRPGFVSSNPPFDARNQSIYLELPLEDVQIQNEWLGVSLVAAMVDPTSDRIAVPRAIAEMIYSSIEGASIDPHLSDTRGTVFSYPCSTPIDFKFRLSQASTSMKNDREHQAEESERTFRLNQFRMDTLEPQSTRCIGAVYGLEDLTDIAGDVGLAEGRLSFQSHRRRR